MISSIEFDQDFSKEVNGIILESFDAANTDKVKLYLPNIMPNIQKGKPMISNLTTKGKDAFINKSIKPKLTSSVLRQKNYITAKISANTVAVDLTKSINQVTSGTKKVAYIINANTTVRAKFLNAKLSKLSFSISNNTSRDVRVVTVKK